MVMDFGSAEANTFTAIKIASTMSVMVSDGVFSVVECLPDLS